VTDRSVREDYVVAIDALDGADVGLAVGHVVIDARHRNASVPERVMRRDIDVVAAPERAKENAGSAPAFSRSMS